MATFEYKKKNLMKRTCVFVLIFFSISVNLIAREESISLYPSKAPQPKDKIKLLMPSENQNDCDAQEFLTKAIESLPDESTLNEIANYVKMPMKEFDAEKARQIITQTQEIINQLEKASQCSKCTWPYQVELNNYRRIAYILALKSRIHIVEGEYEKAINIIRINLQLAQHLRKNDDVIYGLVSIAISALSLQQIEDLIQRPDNPNLYYALEHLPKPLIDIKELIKYEQRDVKKRIENLSKRLERDKAALQCLEALRLYAAENNGTFPNKLDDIKTVEIPVNSFTGKPKAEIPPEIEKEEPLIYNITFRKEQ
ncbi:MAG: hypothetical protein ACYTE8_13525 [Planctomycetota bacterium]|jgi:hypothetical protein